MRSNPALSRDGLRLALSLNDDFPAADVWVYDLADGTGMRLTLEPSSEACPIWTPDGSRLIYERASPRFDLYRIAADGSGPGELLHTDSFDKIPTSVSPDGATLVFDSWGLHQTGYDIWQLPLRRDGKPEPLIQTGFDEWGGACSPDGHWLAFTSNESGRAVTYRPLSSAGTRRESRKRTCSA